MTFDNPTAFVGLAIIPIVLPLLLAHVRQFAQAIEAVLDHRVRDANATPWPIVRDVVGVSLVVLVWLSGNAPVWLDNAYEALLVGIVLSEVGGQIRDQTVAVQGAIAARAAPPAAPAPPLTGTPPGD